MARSPLSRRTKRSTHSAKTQYQNSKQIFTEKELRSLSPNFHITVFERFIYFHDRSAYSAAGKYCSWTMGGRACCCHREKKDRGTSGEGDSVQIRAAS